MLIASVVLLAVAIILYIVLTPEKMAALVSAAATLVLLG